MVKKKTTLETHCQSEFSIGQMEDNKSNLKLVTDEVSKMNKDAQMRAAINQKLIETGERERLKELLRAKLIECGWKDQLKAHCKDNDFK
uniref:ENY2 transcription and export complex 2 subunit n=1 Tax=Pongo abelii TaxID=9601 RepID=A0A8I5YLW7_PONAB